MYIVLIPYHIIIKILTPLPLRGGFVISLGGSIPWLATEARFNYHTVGCRIARLMVTYVIHTEPGTSAQSEPKGNKLKNNITVSRPGLKLHQPKMEKRNPYQFLPGVGTPSTHNGKMIHTPEDRYTTTKVLLNTTKRMKNHPFGSAHFSINTWNFWINYPIIPSTFSKIQWTN